MDSNTNPLGIKKISAPGVLASRAIIRSAELHALSDASTIIQAAHTRADEIIEAARLEAESICVEARNQTSAEVWHEAQALLNDLKKLREEVTEQSVEVAQSILQKAWEILCGQLNQTEKLRCALGQAGRYFVSTSAMKLRVHPSGLTDAQDWLDEQRNSQPGLELMTIEPDTSVRQDEVRLYLDRGGVIRADFVGTVEILKAQWS